jgi:hypothetical protein
LFVFYFVGLVYSYGYLNRSKNQINAVSVLEAKKV